jgi:hypothetical protein
MDANEARTVVEAARLHVSRYEWGDALGLLRPLHGAAVLQGYEQGAVAYLLGITMGAGGDWQGCEPLLREAIATGDAETRELAETALSQILHQEVADLAIQDGEGIDPDECPAVLAAADEAFHTRNWDLAQSNYQALYGGRRVPENYRYAGALGLGRCEAYRGNYDVGAQYAEYVVENDPNLEVDAANLLEWIKGQRAAVAAVADGATPDELKELKPAAVQALNARDYDHAFAIYEAIANGPTIAPVDRAIGYLGMGWVQWHRGEDDEARANMRIAARDGSSETAATAEELLAALAREQRAEQLIEQLKSL